MRFLIVIHILLVQFSLTAQNYNGCAQNSPIHVVVLGSSTAAGTGPSSSDSAWVNRYRRHLQALNPQNVVTNLGVGGTTTYNIMPDWFS
ncbi:MAG: lysophospholipase L1-like esterase, partial [Vicingaceae bacterium]